MKNTSAHGLAPAYSQEQFIFTGTGQVEAQLLASLEALKAALDPAALAAPIDTGSSFKGHSIDDAGGSHITRDGDFITRLNGTAVEVTADGTIYQVDGIIGGFYGFLRSDVGIDYNHFAGTLINTGVISGKGNAIQQSTAYSGEDLLSINNSGAIIGQNGAGISTALNRTWISNDGLVQGSEYGISLIQSDGKAPDSIFSIVFNEGGEIISAGTAIYVKNMSDSISSVSIANNPVDGRGGVIRSTDPNGYAILIDDNVTQASVVNTNGIIEGHIALTGSGGNLTNSGGIIRGNITIGTEGNVVTNQGLNNNFGRIDGDIEIHGRWNILGFKESETYGDVDVTSSYRTIMVVNAGAEIFGNITIDNADDIEGGYVDFAIATGSTIPGGAIYGDVSIQSKDVYFTIASTGAIAGNVSIEGTGYVDVANSGEIAGDLSVQGVNAFAFNEGNISGSVTFENSFSADFNNTGHITGNVTWNSELGSFFNSGTVIGDIHIGATIMRGSNDGGLIDGSIHMGASASRFDNDGGIVSQNVFMGIGNNTFSNYGGDVHGVVYGEAGDNEYFSGMNADTFVSGTGADQFFILWAGPQGKGEDLKYANNGHDTFKDFAIGDDSFVFVYGGTVYDTAETSLIEVAKAVREAGGDYDFSFDEETWTLTLILEFEGGGQFDVVFDDRSVDAFLAGQGDFAPFEYMMM